MKIQSKKTGSFKYLITLSLVIALLLFSFQMTFDKSDKNVKVKKNEIEKATILFNTVNIDEMVTKGINQIHSDSICTMYVNNLLGTPYLYYLYKAPLSPELLSDRTFLHVHLKDKTEWLKQEKGKFINLDFTRKLDEIKINDVTYFIQKAPLLNDHLQFDNIDFINTGRYRYRRGQSYAVRDIKVDSVSAVEISSAFKNVIISIKENELKKVEQKRVEALRNGVLTSDDSDLVKAKISTENNIGLKSLIRLKGDWTDHLRDTLKWSYKIKLEGEETLFGMSKFSIQHPIVRGYAWEWLYQKTIKENDLIGLRYDFLNVELQIEKKDTIVSKQIGIMAFEESIDKILIENNKRREGVILSFDEGILWDDRKRQRDLQLPENTNDAEVRAVASASIRVFNENRILATPGLKKQFDAAKNMLHGLRTEKLKVSEVFDVDKLTMYVALSNLFGGHHGLIWHNLRIYYNPVTNKLEPAASDANAGYKIEKIRHYLFAENDPIYQEKLIEKLELVSSEKFVQDLYDRNYDELNALMLNLKTEFKVNFDHSVLEHNSNLIKKEIYPATDLITHLSKQNAKVMVLDVENITNFPIVISNIQTEKGKVLSESISEQTIWPGEIKKVELPLKKAFLNAFISKKNKRGEFRYPKDLTKINLSYNILGSSHRGYGKIIPYVEENNALVQQYKQSIAFNYESFDFVEEKEDNKTIILKSGSHVLAKNLRIPAGYTVIIEKGFHLDLKNNSSFYSYSPIIGKGSAEEPIKFNSSDSTGGGILISNADEKSILKHCNFSNLSFPTLDNWSLSGAVNFNESDVEITNSVFEKNRSEDGLNIIRSNFVMDVVSFRDTQSDAFDGDFVIGTLTNATFSNCGNDGIDVSGSKLKIENIEVINSSDKAISIGEGSSLTGNNIKIVGGEIGVVSKDLSTIELTDLHIENARLAISCFQKKSEFGPGQMIANSVVLLNNELDYLIEEKSALTLNDKLVETKSKKVIELMYGNEYGKSSK